jgi:DNA sulfur modification protein DndD
MRLSEIALRNWKTYRRFQLSLPHDDARPVVLLEGDNGSGKTSLLEAIILGLYGRLGLPLIARASTASRQDRSYERFMERALSSSARQGRSHVSVELVFDTDRDRLTIERVWHFLDGAMRKDDEEVRIYFGADRKVLALPGPEDDERFVRDFLAQNVLADNLAGFFILDGENLERMANANANGQVRAALDAAMGIDRLRGAASDLRSYARERRRQLPEESAAAAELAATAQELERETQQRSATADAILAAIEPLREQREEVVGRIGRLHGDSYRAFKEHFEEREKVSRDRDAVRDDLRRLLSGDLAQALAGGALRRSAVARIAAEEEAERARSGEMQNLERFEEFIELVQQRSGLSPEQREALGAAWREMWSRPGGTDTKPSLFSYLGQSDRRAVAMHLDRLGSVSAQQIRGLAKAVATADDRIASLDTQLGAQRGLDEQSRDLADRLTEIQSELSVAETRHGQEMTALEVARERLAKTNADLAMLAGASAEAAATTRRTLAAEQYADLIDDLSTSATPENLEALSGAITTAYRAIAHKSVVQRVVVDQDGGVALLDAAGKDLRDLDASAGESHVFALSLMSALAGLASDFPIIMDSPFARLDTTHRRNVIEHFSSMGRQLILLVHPAELRPEELELIATRAAEKISLPSTDAPAAVSGGTA